MIKPPERRKKERRAFRMIVLVTQIGICMMVPIFFCVFLGRLISEKTGQPLWFLLMLLTGCLAGFRSSWQIISRFTGLTVSSLKGEDRRSADLNGPEKGRTLAASADPSGPEKTSPLAASADLNGPEKARSLDGPAGQNDLEGMMGQKDFDDPYDPEWEDDPPGSERLRP